MDDIDIGEIEEILKEAARIRKDASTTISDDKLLDKSYLDSYFCKSCGEENSKLSLWCFKCGLQKNKQPNLVHKTEQFTSKCNVYNCDQILPNNNSIVHVNFNDARKINSTTSPPRGKVMEFKYNEDKDEPMYRVDSLELDLSLLAENSYSVQQNVSQKDRLAHSEIDLSVQNEPSDVIIYDRTFDSKKGRKKLYIKPLSQVETKDVWASSVRRNKKIPFSKTTTEPVRITTNGRVSSTSISNLETLNSCPNFTSSRPNSSSSRQKPLSRPQSANIQTRNNRSCSRPSSSSINKNMNSRSSGSLTSFQKRPNSTKTPPVFQRLYENDKKVRRSVKSSPLLFDIEKSRMVKTSMVALTPPNLSLKSEKESLQKTAEHLVINSRISKIKKSHSTRNIDHEELGISGQRHPRLSELRSFERPVVIKTDWERLPPEIWVKVMSLVPSKDLSELSKVSSYFYNVSSDQSLWKRIEIVNKELTDSKLVNIGDKTPTSLSFKGCQGHGISSVGLRYLFRKCAAKLQEITVIECVGGELVSNSFLFHLSARCENITNIYLSMCSLGNDSLLQFAKRTNRLEKFFVPMCAGISSEGFKVLLEKHHNSLQCIDITGCYTLPSTILSQMKSCSSLAELYLSNCIQVTSETLTDLSTTLAQLHVLDIRGCKGVSSGSIVQLITANPHIHTLSLGSVTSVNDELLNKISGSLAQLRILDLSGCLKVSSKGLSGVFSQHPITALDLSCTAVNYRGCRAIGNYLATSLTEISFNLCTDINDECMKVVAGKCTKLKRLSLFGCSYVRYLGILQRVNKKLVLEV